MNAQILGNIESISDDVLLALLHFKPCKKQGTDKEKIKGDWVKRWTQYDATPFMPKNPLVFVDIFNEERLFCASADLLMADPSDQFDEMELIQVCGGDISYRWNGIKKRKSAPRAFIRPGCDVFWDSCQRTVYKSGREDIMTNVFGWNKKLKKAISCPLPEHKPHVIAGTERTLEKEMGQTLCLMASVSEDVKVNWSVTIKKDSAFTVYSTEEKIKELCEMRDAPLSASGNRAAICHWVRAHKRKTSNAPVDVKKHLRGVVDFPLGDMRVTITPPTGFIIA